MKVSILHDSVYRVVDCIELAVYESAVEGFEDVCRDHFEYCDNNPEDFDKGMYSEHTLIVHIKYESGAVEYMSVLSTEDLIIDKPYYYKGCQY